MKKINKKICAWKVVAENDLEKLAKGNDCISLNPKKLCYTCDGTEKYANKIKCGAYHVLRRTS